MPAYHTLLCRWPQQASQVADCVDTALMSLQAGQEASCRHMQGEQMGLEAGLTMGGPFRHKEQPWSMPEAGVGRSGKLPAVPVIGEPLRQAASWEDGGGGSPQTLSACLTASGLLQFATGALEQP